MWSQPEGTLRGPEELKLPFCLPPPWAFCRATPLTRSKPPGRRWGEQLRDPRQTSLQGCKRGEVKWRLDLDGVIGGVWSGAPIFTFHLLETRAQSGSLPFTHTTLDPASINGLSKYLMFYSHGKEHTQGIWILVNEINTYKSKSICLKHSQKFAMKGWGFFLARLGDSNSFVRGRCHSLCLGQKPSKTSILGWNVRLPLEKKSFRKSRGQGNESTYVPWHFCRLLKKACQGQHPPHHHFSLYCPNTICPCFEPITEHF